MEIRIKAYAYTIDIITEIRYFCKCNNAVFGKFRFIFTCAISKTDCSLHHSFHALFKISGNGKFVRTAAPTFPKPHYPSPRTKLASLVKGRWLDGTTQTVALLRPTCDMSALFILQTFLPSRRKDCHTTPSKTALSLAPHHILAI